MSASSYIKTEGSQVTRAADSVSRALGDEFNKNEFTFFVEYIPYDITNGVRASISDGSFGNSVYFANNLIVFRLGGTAMYSTLNSEVSGQRKKVALSIKSGAVVLAKDGTTKSSPATFSTPLPFDRLYTSASWEGNPNDVINTIDCVLYPYALTEAELVKLTS